MKPRMRSLLALLVAALLTCLSGAPMRRAAISASHAANAELRRPSDRVAHDAISPAHVARRAPKRARPPASQGAHAVTLVVAVDLAPAGSARVPAPETLDSIAPSPLAAPPRARGPPTLG